jgi:hypothetical protein
MKSMLREIGEGQLRSQCLKKFLNFVKRPKSISQANATDRI